MEIFFWGGKLTSEVEIPFTFKNLVTECIFLGKHTCLERWLFLTKITAVETWLKLVTISCSKAK